MGFYLETVPQLSLAVSGIAAVPLRDWGSAEIPDTAKDKNGTFFRKKTDLFSKPVNPFNRFVEEGGIHL